MSTLILRADFQKVISHALALYAQKNNFNRIDTSKFNATFFYFIYNFRKLNNMFEDEFELDWKTFKKQTHIVINYAEKNFEWKLSHQQFLSQICYALNVQKLKESDQIIFHNMSLAVGKKQKIRLLNDIKANFKNLNNNVINWGIDTLIRFTYNNKESVPFELFALLVNDCFINYIYNKEFFIGKNAFNSYLMEKCIAESIFRIGRIINGKDHLSMRRGPESSDFFLQLEINQMDETYSLPLLCDYFGDEAWYRFFVGVDKESNDQYVKFKQL